MIICILLLLIVVLGVAVALSNRHDDTPIVTAKGDCSTCSATPDAPGSPCSSDSSADCMHMKMLKASLAEPEYFDDEHLDAYKGRAADSYTEAEADEFSEVLYSMHPDEVPLWCSSLSQRSIEVPDQIKDELLLLIQ